MSTDKSFLLNSNRDPLDDVASDLLLAAVVEARGAWVGKYSIHYEYIESTGQHPRLLERATKVDQYPKRYKICADYRLERGNSANPSYWLEFILMFC